MAKECTAYMHKTAALIDPLTGIWNRRGFMSETDRWMRDSRKKSVNAAVLFLDLDNFKAINDSYGHRVGDEVLQLLAATAKSVIRSTDVVGRLGGEEFAIILRGAPRDHAMSIAERIRSAFADHAAVVDGETVAATVSIGLVIHEGPMIELAELLRKADQALYRAKERGRNRVELMGPEYFAGRDENAAPALGAPTRSLA
jgi:diguanylate cyclase (GGDEF)-like protein